MRTNATIIEITRSGGAVEARSIRCLFIGSTLAEQGESAAKLTGTLLVPHHQLVRDLPAPPHGFPKPGDTVLLRLDAPAGEFGDDIAFVIDSARAHPGGPLKHWHYTLK